MEDAAAITSVATSFFPERVSQPLRLGKVELSSRFLLAPLAGYTTLAFRLAIRELGGVGLCTTDLVNARALKQQSRKTLELIQTCAVDRPLSIQIYGAVAHEMAEAARWLQDYGATVIDINMGCPVHKVNRSGAGSALMCDPGNTVELVRSIVAAVQIPVTVKMRLGWDDSHWSAPAFARQFEEVGVAAIIIHGRTRAQGFGGSVQLEGIRAVVDAVESIPVIGNGDVRSAADAARMLEVTGCAGVAIGRGALLDPWIFARLRTALATGVPGPRASYHDRLDFMSRHLHLLTEQRGERFGCLTFRKVANWYCRIIRPGREIQQRMMKLERVADFDAMVAGLRARPVPADWDEQPEPTLAVPQGPISHW